MRDAIAKYLAKHADLVTRPLVCGPCDGIDQAVVIPALAEKDSLFDTLASLAENPPPDLARTLVICVINNRVPPLAGAAQIADNQETLAVLDALVRGGDIAPALRQISRRLRLAYVDAASSGRELPPKGGVGLARKIGLDWAVAILARRDGACKLLFSLDADTRVEPNYLSAVRSHFEQAHAWAGVAGYAHPLGGSVEEIAAIVCYELFLRYHVLGLRYAGSPYAFPAIGSTMVCRVDAYVAVSGMNQRQAGEDFYFLQELAKTGGVDMIHATTVYPSARSVPRAPFGTAQRVRRFLDAARDDARRAAEYLVYDPRCYRVLREWLAHVAAHLEDGSDSLLKKAGVIDSQLKSFLEAQGFAEAWPRLQRNSGDSTRLLQQFHRWFDGFRTLKLIHHLRDTVFPNVNIFAAIRTLAEWTDLPVFDVDVARLPGDVQLQKDLLLHLRTVQLKSRVSLECGG